MRKLIFFSLILTFVSCQESLEERCDREAREFTKKNCPVVLDKDMTLDSMTFDKATTTIHYYYTVGGQVDDAQALKRVNARKTLLDALRNTTSIKNYKEAGYNFNYIYWSKSKKGKKVADYTFTKKEY